MFAQYGFPFQVYRTSPDTPYPTSQASAQFLKREVDEPALDGVNEGHLMYIDDSYIWEGVDYTPAPTVTSTTVDAAPETTSLTKARTRVESPGPLETAAAEEQEELRRYL
jgi:hypothetical protein